MSHDELETAVGRFAPQMSYLCLSAPTCSQNSKTGQVEHLSKLPVYIMFKRYKGRDKGTALSPYEIEQITEAMYCHEIQNFESLQYNKKMSET